MLNLKLHYLWKPASYLHSSRIWISRRMKEIAETTRGWQHAWWQRWPAWLLSLFKSLECDFTSQTRLRSNLRSRLEGKSRFTPSGLSLRRDMMGASYLLKQFILCIAPVKNDVKQETTIYTSTEATKIYCYTVFRRQQFNKIKNEAGKYKRKTIDKIHSEQL